MIRISDDKRVAYVRSMRNVYVTSIIIRIRSICLIICCKWPYNYSNKGIFINGYKKIKNDREHFRTIPKPMCGAVKNTILVKCKPKQSSAPAAGSSLDTFRPGACKNLWEKRSLQLTCQSSYHVLEKRLFCNIADRRLLVHGPNTEPGWWRCS